MRSVFCGKIHAFPSGQFLRIILVVNVEGESGGEAIPQCKRLQARLRKYNVIHITIRCSRESAGDPFCRLLFRKHRDTSGKLALDLVKTIDAARPALSFRISVGKIVAVVVIIVPGTPGGDAVCAAVEINLQTAIQQIQTRCGAIRMESFRLRDKAVVGDLHAQIEILLVPRQTELRREILFSPP